MGDCRYCDIAAAEGSDRCEYHAIVTAIPPKRVDPRDEEVARLLTRVRELEAEVVAARADFDSATEIMLRDTRTMDALRAEVARVTGKLHATEDELAGALQTIGRVTTDLDHWRSVAESRPDISAKELETKLAVVTVERDEARHAAQVHCAGKVNAWAERDRAESALAQALAAMPTDHETDCLRDCAEYMASRWTKTPPVPRSALAALDRLDAFRASQQQNGGDDA